MADEAAPPPTRLFLVRHAERLDHAWPEWAAHASRPHDSPLSTLGSRQAQLAGEHLRSRAAAAVPSRLVVRSSPLIRCVQTAAQITRALDQPELPVQVDDSLCEEETYLRPRMMGTHRQSVPAQGRAAVAPTCADPRGVCRPVLLSASDLVVVHPHVDLGYEGTVCPVRYDSSSGAELNALTGETQPAAERAAAIVRGIGLMAPTGCSTVLVTHGAFARRVGLLLTGEEGWESFGYAEMVELEWTAGGGAGASGAWRLVDRWRPAQEDAGATPARLD